MDAIDALICFGYTIDVKNKILKPPGFIEQSYTRSINLLNDEIKAEPELHVKLLKQKVAKLGI